MNKKKRAQKALKTLYGPKRPKTGLSNWKTDWQFLFCVIMSARTNDDQVSKVAKSLFKNHSTLEDFAEAQPKEIEKEIQSIGFYRSKAGYLKKSAEILVKKHKGKVPEKTSDLTNLPGVGEKTAHVYQGVILGKSEGIAVDTHVARVSRRLDLTKHPSNKRDKIKKDLEKLFNKEQYAKVNPAFFWHGREVCVARKPKCEECPVSGFCPGATA